MNINKHNQTIGGISGIIEASLYILGFVLLFSFFKPILDDTNTGLDKLKFIIEKKAIFQPWIILLYVVFGIVLIPLTIAIHENFKDQTSIWIKATPVFGFIWSVLVISSGMVTIIGIDKVASLYATDPSSALTSWTTIEAIQDGLGGGVEVIGGIWVFLISISALKQTVFNKFLNYLGLIVGGAGILTIIPGFKDLGAVFGITQIIWFVWIGIIMIKNKPRY